MGWGGGGLLTKRIGEKKRNYVVIAVDILVIIAFIWFAFTQRASFEQGYGSCVKQVCTEPFNAPNICRDILERMNITLEPSFCNESIGGCLTP